MTDSKTFNKWKVAFFTCLICSFISLIAICSASFYEILDLGITNSYMQDGYEHTQKDLETLALIINETDLSKPQIEEKLLEHHIIEEWYFDKEEYQRKGIIPLNNIVLHFENDKLVRVDEEWN